MKTAFFILAFAILNQTTAFAATFYCEADCQMNSEKHCDFETGRTFSQKLDESRIYIQVTQFDQIATLMEKKCATTMAASKNNPPKGTATDDYYGAKCQYTGNYSTAIYSVNDKGELASFSAVHSCLVNQ